MKKILCLVIVSCCILAMPVVAEIKSNSISSNAIQNNKSDLFRPMHATNIKIVKKVPASLAIKETKGSSNTPPGQDKEDDSSERVATGDLGSATTGNKYAVVIGICDYPDEGEMGDICLSDGDSYYMVKTLIENYGYNPSDILWFRDMGSDGEMISVGDTKMKYEVPTHEKISWAVMEIRGKIESDDEFVFFFSGHGSSGEVNDGFPEGKDDGEKTDEGILVHDSDGEMDGDGYATLDFIWDGELRSWFYGFNTERVVFIFDTCLAGGMNDVAYDEYDDIYNNRVIVMSSKETQSSGVYSNGEFGEGVFSHYFVNEGMLQGLADGYNQISDEDDYVAIEEAFDYTKENFPPYLKFRQNPVISDEFFNDLLL